MFQRILLILLLLFSFGCAKQSPPQWQYVEKLPVDQKGNEFIAAVDNLERVVVKVDDSFRWLNVVGSSFNKSHVYIRKTDHGDHFVYIRNRFRTFKEKFTIGGT